MTNIYSALWTLSNITTYIWLYSIYTVWDGRCVNSGVWLFTGRFPSGFWPWAQSLMAHPHCIQKPTETTLVWPKTSDKNAVITKHPCFLFTGIAFIVQVLNWAPNQVFLHPSSYLNLSSFRWSTWPGLWMCWHSLVAGNENETTGQCSSQDTLCECLNELSLESPGGGFQPSKARWSQLLTDDSSIVLSDSSVWEVLWIQSWMPLLLWCSCLDTKSTWTSIWSQHVTLHVRQLLSQNRLFFHLLLLPSTESIHLHRASQGKSFFFPVIDKIN